MEHLWPALLLALTTCACGTIGIENLHGGNIDSGENPYTADEEDEADATGDSAVGDTSFVSTGDAVPEIVSFFTTETDEGQRFDIRVDDLDDDMDGGDATIVCGTTQTTYAWPDEMEWDANTYVVWDSALFPREQQHSCTLKVTDAEGHASDPATTEWYRGTWTAMLIEDGDTPADLTVLGEIELPAEIHGEMDATGGYQSGTDLIYTGDQDRFRFSVADSATRVIRLDWTSTADFDLWVENDTGTTLAYSISAGTNPPERIKLGLQASVDYVILVNGWSGDPGPWTVRIE